MTHPTPNHLDAYLARIGYDGPREPTLAVLHAITAAHSQSIPFENLDVLLGRGISLEPTAIFTKLVHERRGGYCFEQNGLLLQMLGELGFQVAPLSARVRLQRPRDFLPTRTHVFVRVELDGETWLTDVGVGAASLTSAIRLRTGNKTGAEQATPHEFRRIVQEDAPAVPGGTLWYHQMRYASGPDMNTRDPEADWQDVCEFTLEQMPLMDRELANWYTSAHPQSHFRNRLLVARAAPSGERLSILNSEFAQRKPDGSADKITIGSPAHLLELLDEHFGLRFGPDVRFCTPDLLGLLGSVGPAWPV